MATSASISVGLGEAKSGCGWVTTPAAAMATADKDPGPRATGGERLAGAGTVARVFSAAAAAAGAVSVLAWDAVFFATSLAESSTSAIFSGHGGAVACRSSAFCATALRACGEVGSSSWTIGDSVGAALFCGTGVTAGVVVLGDGPPAGPATSLAVSTLSDSPTTNLQPTTEGRATAFPIGLQANTDSAASLEGLFATCVVAGAAFGATAKKLLTSFGAGFGTASTTTLSGTAGPCPKAWTGAAGAAGGENASDTRVRDSEVTAAGGEARTALGARRASASVGETEAFGFALKKDCMFMAEGRRERPCEGSSASRQITVRALCGL